METVEAHAIHFLNYVHTHEICTEDRKKRNVAGISGALFRTLRHSIDEAIIKETRKRRRYPHRAIGPISRSVIQNEIKKLESAESIGKDISERAIARQYRSEIEAEAEAAFQGISPVQSTLAMLVHCASLALCRDRLSERHSGLVIAGFGSAQMFPSLVAVEVDGVIANRLKLAVRNVTDASKEEEGAVIIPFAEKEMMQRFVEGVDFEYQDYLFSQVETLLRTSADEIIDAYVKDDAKEKAQADTGRAIEENMNKLKTRLRNVRYTNYVRPIIDAVGSLPKEEMASMAEALVNLAAIRRRVSTEEETVGGPIDVAIISKGDGFIWIRRKHYFDIRFNPHFAANYFRLQEEGRVHDGTEEA